MFSIVERVLLFTHLLDLLSDVLNTSTHKGWSNLSFLNSVLIPCTFGLSKKKFSFSCFLFVVIVVYSFTSLGTRGSKTVNVLVRCLFLSRNSRFTLKLSSRPVRGTYFMSLTFWLEREKGENERLPSPFLLHLSFIKMKNFMVKVWSEKH